MKVLRIVFPLLVGCALAHAQTPDQDRDQAEILANEHAWSESFVTGDTSRAAQFIADDFVGTDTHGGHYSKTDELGYIRALPHTTAARLQGVTIRLFGDTAVAQVNEHDTGPAPGLRPLHTVATDVWVKRGAKWVVVSGVDIDTGFETPEKFKSDTETIGKQRTANNAALQSRDLDAFVKLFDEDALFVWSDGSTAVGRASLRKNFAGRFKDAALKTYIRTPQQIVVAEDGARAVEQGRWTGVFAGRVTGGDYMAHWTRTGGGWKVRGEVYVRLYCAGAGCAR